MGNDDRRNIRILAEVVLPLDPVLMVDVCLVHQHTHIHTQKKKNRFFNLKSELMGISCFLVFLGLDDEDKVLSWLESSINKAVFNVSQCMKKLVHEQRLGIAPPAKEPHGILEALPLKRVTGGSYASCTMLQTCICVYQRQWTMDQADHL